MTTTMVNTAGSAEEEEDAVVVDQREISLEMLQGHEKMELFVSVKRSDECLDMARDRGIRPYSRK